MRSIKRALLKAVTLRYLLVLVRVLSMQHKLFNYRKSIEIKTRKGKEMALTENEVLAGIREIVEEVAGVDPATIEMGKSFTDDLDVDSLSMVEVVVAAEERFGIKIPDDEVTKMATVGDAVNFIVSAAS
jgi:acyl carrier protein